MVEKDTRGTNHLSPLNKTTTPNLWYNQRILTFGLPQRIVDWILEDKRPQQHDSGTHTPKSTDQASTTQVVHTGRRKKTKRPWSMSRFLLSGHILEGAQNDQNRLGGPGDGLVVQKHRQGTRRELTRATVTIESSQNGSDVLASIPLIPRLNILVLNLTFGTMQRMMPLHEQARYSGLFILDQKTKIDLRVWMASA